MAHLKPGEYIVPLSGTAEKKLKSREGVPFPRDTFKVVGKPYPFGLFGRVKRMSVAVERMDKDNTAGFLRVPPDHEFVVFHHCARRET